MTIVQGRECKFEKPLKPIKNYVKSNCNLKIEKKKINRNCNQNSQVNWQQSSH